MKTTAEMIEVMQAFDRGEKIECSSLTGNDFGAAVIAPVWNWLEFDYRVVRKPAECWVWVFPSGRCGATFESEDQARRVASGNEGRAVLMREVTA